MGSEVNPFEVENLTVASEVRQALAGLGLPSTDRAAQRLAILYARELDKSTDKAKALATFGPKLFEVLEALGATPLGRSKMKKPTEKPSGHLAEFHARTA